MSRARSTIYRTLFAPMKTPPSSHDTCMDEPAPILPEIESSNFLLNFGFDEKRLAQYLTLSLTAKKPEGKISRILLVGEDSVTARCFEAVKGCASEKGITVSCLPLASPDLTENLESADRAIICEAPQTDSAWSQVLELLLSHDSKTTTLWQQIRDFLLYDRLRGPIEYLGDLNKIWSAYNDAGFKDPIVQPVAEFNERVPVSGQSVLELGPLDGFSTAALLRFGVRSITCVELRPENHLKVLLAKQLNLWNTVELLFENFNCLHPELHGRFDIVFAHGVYYHTSTPFRLLENCSLLGDTIYIGGFCASSEDPAGPWTNLKYEGDTYRAKPFQEYEFHTNGLSSTGYFFHAQDLMNWFQRRDFSIETVYRGDSGMPHIASEYIRFIARKA